MSTQVAEKFSIACPQCGKGVTVSRAHIGKKGRCPACQTVFPITSPAAPARSPALAHETHSPNTTSFEDLQPLNSPAGNSIWSEVGPGPFSSAPLPSQAWPGASDEPRLEQGVAPNTAAVLATDYINRARTDRGGTIQQIEEEDTQYRFFTSWGSVIGGICTMCFGLLLIAFFILFWISVRGIALGVIIIIVGGGWLVQGMNYVTYYYWKDKGGRG